ncbi:MAG: hypothetical protein ACK4LQ_02215 [Pararhodobacter sp.]
MSDHLTPLQVCLRLIGPEPELARVLRYHRTAPYGWHFASKNRAAGDLPSMAVARRLLAHAAAKGIPLTAEHLIWGATAAEIEKLVWRVPRDLPADLPALPAPARPRVDDPPADAAPRVEAAE